MISHGLAVRLGVVLGLLATLAVSSPTNAGTVVPAAPLPFGVVQIFADGFESAECSFWSLTSSPLAGPDFDTDSFGDRDQPVVNCQLPPGLVPDATDCDDGDPEVHPGAVELCNGVDDDCDPDTGDGSADPGVGLLCDGGDSDLCDEGTTVCTGGAIECTDTTDSTLDLCNGVDDDCDPASPDGSEDPLVGLACDGADTDLCLEGTNACTDGAIECTDDTGSTVDLCNGLDDDCDPASPDGSEDPLIGLLCDGDDSDLCQEGNNVCPAGALVCSDETDSTIDLCNGLDDDCDPASPDGSEDPLVGLACDGADGDLCLEGTTFCAAGSLDCSDTTGTTPEVCAGDGQDEDCDGEVDEGFLRDDNPSCFPPFNLGSISGDTGANVVTANFYNEQFNVVRVTEDSNQSVYLSARAVLYSPPGIDFDLHVYCAACGGAVIGSSQVHSLSGHFDVVDVRNDDDFAQTDDFDVIIEVRHFASNFCGYWELQVFGNLVAPTNNCDP